MNVAQITKKYIREHSSILDCLNDDLINYSALARKICAENKLQAFDAVLMACRRFPQELGRQKRQDKDIENLIKRAKTIIRNKMIVATVNKSNAFQKAVYLQQLIRKEKGDFWLIEGEETLTIITNSEHLGAVQETFGGDLKDVCKHLAQITMVFPKQLMTTVGACAYIFRKFAEHGINIREAMSCWTDMMLVVDELDMVRAMELLQSN